MKKSIIAKIAERLAISQPYIIESGFDSSKGCVIGYLFSNKLSTPKFIAKMARLVNTSHLMTEYNNIKFIISKINDNDLSMNVPDIIDYTIINQHEVLVLKYIEGSILSDVSFNLTRNTLINIVYSLGHWLVDLSKVTCQPMSESFFNKLITIPMKNFIECSSHDEILIVKVKKSLEILEENHSNLFTVCSHRDFRGENIIINPVKKVYIIDWESMEMRGLPAVDFVHLLISLGLIENKFILQTLNRFASEIGLSKKVIASLYIAFIVGILQENLVQIKNTAHFKQSHLMNILYKMRLDYDFRFSFS
ncbi:MAG: phosphotransferase [bacterium]